jgi:hypothetical protein
MHSVKTEQMRAEQLSAAIDQMLRFPDTQPVPSPSPLWGEGRGEGEGGEGYDPGLLDTARHLAGLVQQLGPVGPELEERIACARQRQGAAERARRPPEACGTRWPRLRPAWGMAALAAVLLVVALLTPLGQTALASFMAVFNLGRTEVHITPAHLTTTATAVAGSTAVVGDLTLEQAQAQVSFAIPQPADLPPGYRLLEVKSYTYPDLPAWIPQPFCIELVYDDGQEHQFALRLYPITLGDRASISRLNLEATPIQDVRDVDVNGKPGVLLSLGAPGAETIWQDLVWEQDDLILALSAASLTEEELMRIARSVR